MTDKYAELEESTSPSRTELQRKELAELKRLREQHEPTEQLMHQAFTAETLTAFDTPVELPLTVRIRAHVYAAILRALGFVQNIARWLLGVDVDKSNQDLFNELTLSNIKQQQKLQRGIRADLNVLVDAFNRQAEIQQAEQAITRELGERISFYEHHVETIRYQRTRYDEAVARRKAADDARAKLAAPVEQLELVKSVPVIEQPFNPHGVRADVVIDASRE